MALSRPVILPTNVMMSSRHLVLWAYLLILYIFSHALIGIYFLVWRPIDFVRRLPHGEMFSCDPIGFCRLVLLSNNTVLVCVEMLCHELVRLCYPIVLSIVIRASCFMIYCPMTLLGQVTWLCCLTSLSEPLVSCSFYLP